MSNSFSRFKVTGSVVDNGDWVLVPVALEASSPTPPAQSDVLAATFQNRGGIQLVTAGFGLIGGGVGADVTVAVDAELIATKQALDDHVHDGSDITTGVVSVTRLPVGTSSLHVCAGDDPRLSDARVPLDGSVTAEKIAVGAVAADRIAAGAVTSAKIADAAVVVGKIGNGAVGSSQIVDASVTTAKLAGGAVTAEKMAADSVTASAIAANAVGSSEIASGSVLNSKLASVASGIIKGRVTANAGSVEDLTASQVRQLLNVADGAEQNVNADWNATAGDSRILNKPSAFPPSAHRHDELYYTETEVNDLLGAKASLAGASFTGNVGIGTPSPSTNLHVNGTLRANSLTDGTTTKTMADVLAGGAGATSLMGLSDVAMSFSGQQLGYGFTLVYNSLTSKWEANNRIGIAALGGQPFEGWPAGSVGRAIQDRATKNEPRFSGLASFGGPVGIGTVIPNADVQLHVNGRIFASSLTDGTTTKTITEILAGAQSLGQLADVTLSGPMSPDSFLLYSFGSWRNERSAGVLAVGPVPMGGWAAGSIGASLAEKAPLASPALTGNATITASSGVPLTVINTGTGNSFVVNDQSSDTTPFVINADGRVGVGVASPLAELHVNGTMRCTSLTDGTTTSTLTSLLESAASARRATHIDQKLTPTTGTAGTAGQMYWDDTNIYIRTSGGWKKAPLYDLAAAPPTSGTAANQVQLTQAQYNALSPKDPNVLYIIID